MMHWRRGWWRVFVRLFQRCLEADSEDQCLADMRTQQTAWAEHIWLRMTEAVGAKAAIQLHAHASVKHGVARKLEARNPKQYQTLKTQMPKNQEDSMERLSDLFAVETPATLGARGDLSSR